MKKILDLTYVAAFAVLFVMIVSMAATTRANADAPKGTIIFNPPVGHSGPPVSDCAALYRKYPGQPSAALARRLNRQFAPCVWEPKKSKEKRPPAPERPEPEVCYTIKEINGERAVVAVACEGKNETSRDQ